MASLTDGLQDFGNRALSTLLGVQEAEAAPPFMKLYRGVQRLPGEVMEGRLPPGPWPYHPWEQTTDFQAVNMKPGHFWTSTNSLVAESYLDPYGGLVMPLDLLSRPEAVLNAKGASWRDYFRAWTGSPRRSPFYKALRDPSVRSILVEDVVDPGMGALARLGEMERSGGESFSEGLSNLLSKYYTGTNVLVKDPSVVRYSITGEPVPPWGGY